VPRLDSQPLRALLALPPLALLAAQVVIPRKTHHQLEVPEDNEDLPVRRVQKVPRVMEVHPDPQDDKE
jgi:hypothetical protein